jgi:hypothetical protein
VIGGDQSPHRNAIESKCIDEFGQRPGWSMQRIQLTLAKTAKGLWIDGDGSSKPRLTVGLNR